MEGETRSINGPIGPNEIGLIFPRNLMAAIKENPSAGRVLLKTLDLFREELAKVVESQRNARTPFHHQALTSAVLAWWLKRGGSIKRFPELAFELRLHWSNPDLPREEIPSERFAIEARERLTPRLLEIACLYKQNLPLLHHFLNCLTI